MHSTTAINSSSNSCSESEEGEDEEDQLLKLTPISGLPQQRKKLLSYPKQIFLIIGNEFCERFSYFGMQAVLAIYLKHKLDFTEDTSTVIYHTFSGLCYFTPIFGAILADQLFGKFKTIFWGSLIYIIGQVILAVAAIPLKLPPVEFTLIGLFLMTVGTGGIKPCGSAFGGDQFKLPEQKKHLKTFFSVWYFTINAGALISTIITPIFRQDFQCFGDETCYPLAFGMPALLMLIAIVILVSGKNIYVHKPPQGSVINQVIGSIWYATKKRFQSLRKPEHWLDHAKGKYSSQSIADTKILLRLLVVYLTFPIYWALFKQTGSRWTFQATRMNGQIGGWIIKPDQMQILNPIFIMILIPSFNRFVYPFLLKFNILKKPLQRMVTGGLINAAAFFISGFLELQLVKTYDKVPQIGESHAHFMNLLPCDISVSISSETGSTKNKFFNIEARLNNIIYDLKPGVHHIKIQAKEACPIKNKTMALTFVAQDKVVTGFLVRSVDDQNLNIMPIREAEDPQKRDDAAPKFRVVVINKNKSEQQNITIRPTEIIPGSENDSNIFNVTTTVSYEGIFLTPYSKLDPGIHDFYLNGQKIASGITLLQGGVHTFVVSEEDQDISHLPPQFSDFLLTKENSVHMLWIIPQVFVITVGEILFSVTALEFSYYQAPISMKSVVQAVFLMTDAIGNIIIIFVAGANLVDQTSEFFLFGCLMIMDMILLSFLACRFTYANVNDTFKSSKSKFSDIHTSDISSEETTKV